MKDETREVIRRPISKVFFYFLTFSPFILQHAFRCKSRTYVSHIKNVFIANVTAQLFFPKKHQDNGLWQIVKCLHIFKGKKEIGLDAHSAYFVAKKSTFAQHFICKVSVKKTFQLKITTTVNMTPN